MGVEGTYQWGKRIYMIQKRRAASVHMFTRHARRDAPTVLFDHLITFLEVEASPDNHIALLRKVQLITDTRRLPVKGIDSYDMEKKVCQPVRVHTVTPCVFFSLDHLSRS